MTSQFVWPSKSPWTPFRRFLLKRHHRRPLPKKYPFKMHQRHTERQPPRQNPQSSPLKKVPKPILAINAAGEKSNAMAKSFVKGVSLPIFGR